MASSGYTHISTPGVDRRNKIFSWNGGKACIVEARLKALETFWFHPVSSYTDSLVEWLT